MSRINRLKQAFRQWYEFLKRFLQSIGLSCSQADLSLFVGNNFEQNSVVVVNVDDLLITGSIKERINSSIKTFEEIVDTKKVDKSVKILVILTRYDEDTLKINQELRIN